MNQKQKPKIELFFGGLAERFLNNENYFISLDWEVTSGIKKYNGRITKDEENIMYNFAGKKLFETFEQCLQQLVEDILKYDKASVEYIERGLITEIKIDEKNVKLEKRESENQITAIQSNLKEKEYKISLHKASKLLKTLGFLTEDGKLKNDMIRKYNQTDRFIELVGDMFVGMNNLKIVDCACGKSYLSFVLNYYLWEEMRIKANFIGLDISERVISESKRIATEMQYNNMQFFQEDLCTFDNDIRPDAVISLHACDTATDMALGYAIRNNAKNIICVPCCHKELLDKFKKEDLESILKHGVLKTRFNDLITDGLRMAKLEACGYKVSCVEYCSPLDTPKNLLIKAKKVSNGDINAQKEYNNLLKTLGVFPAIELYSIINN